MKRFAIFAAKNESLSPKATPLYAIPVFVESWALGPNLGSEVKDENLVVVFYCRVLGFQDQQNLLRTFEKHIFNTL